MTEPPTQLSFDDALAHEGGFDTWCVFQPPAPRRRWHTAAELGVRWRMSADQAEEWLEAFERTGFARRQGDYWLATEKARRVLGFGPEGEA